VSPLASSPDFHAKAVGHGRVGLRARQVKTPIGNCPIPRLPLSASNDVKTPWVFQMLADI
jgi:hypothetical protein